MENRYADVILDISLEKLDRPFGYHIPENLWDRVQVGSSVMVPFGKGNTPRKGYVVRISDTSSFDPQQTKDILGLSKGGVTVEERSLELAAFLKSHYGGTMAQAMKVVMPAKAAVKALEHRSVEVIAQREELLSLLGQAERRHATGKAKALTAFLEERVIPYEWLTGKLGVSGQTLQGLERTGVIRIEVSTSLRNPVHLSGERKAAPNLSREQQTIVEEISEDMAEGMAGEYLIHGITGSGKTEVYLQLIAAAIAMGKQAIFLIPEIALTYQTLMRVYQRFGDRVSVLNSTLSPGEKYDQCRRAKEGEIDVIIGPRSALFTPFPNLGLIVIDEEHESSYKSEATPKYHTAEVARKLQTMTGAALVLGSATPSVESYYRTEQGYAKRFVMTKRLTGGTLPKVYTVDLRQELREGNRSIFSRRLQGLMEDRIAKGQQIMLFLNRRGYAGFISCRACGEVINCPHCAVSLSEHRGNRLVCHYCGYETPKPSLCPKCGSKYISGFKAGTEAIEQKLLELFPNVKTLRMDGDTTKTKDSYEQILCAFGNGEAQILIGTQMIVKGHDFPGVTLVGILAADLSLASGDYRAGEKTFQLLTQAVGRAGRGSLPGEAVIQTYQPEHYAVVQAAAQDYYSFYNRELAYRTLGGYPPVEHLLAIQVFGKYEDSVKRLADRLAAELKREGFPKLLGPAPGGISKVRDLYRYVIYIKQADYSELTRAKDMAEMLLGEWVPKWESVQFDFDPVNML